MSARWTLALTPLLLAGATACPSLDGLVASSDAGSSDPLNCGRVGHDCLGGACVGGVCQPFTLATLSEPIVVQGSYGLLAADDSYLYWIDEFSMVFTRASKATSDTASHGSQAVNWLLATSSIVFGAPPVEADAGVDQADLWTLAKTLDASPSRVVGPDSFVFVTDGTRIAWFSVDTLSACTLPACSDIHVIASGAAYPWNFFADGTNIYMIDQNNNLTSCPWSATACTPAQVTASPIFAYANDVAQDDTSLYFGLVGGNVVRVPKAGGFAITLDPSSSPKRGLAVDATNLYWFDENSGALAALPLAGGPVVTLALGQHSPETNIVADDKALYWIDDVSLWKLAK